MVSGRHTLFLITFAALLAADAVNAASPRTQAGKSPARTAGAKQPVKPQDNLPKPEDCLAASLRNPSLVITKCSEVIKARGISDGSAKHVQYRLMLARAFSAQGKYTEALGNIEAALSVAQQQEGAEPLIERGIIQNKLENYSNAILDFNEAIKLGAGKQITGRAYFNLAISFEMIGKTDAARKQMLAGKVMAPALYDEALREYKTFRLAQETRKRLVKQYFEQGLNELQSKAYDKAVESFQLAASSDSMNLEYQSWIGSVFYEVKNFDKALSYLQIPPPAERWNYYMGRCFLELGLYGEALEAFKLAKSDVPPKNRGVDVSSETAHYIGILNGYAEEYQLGMKFAKEKKHDEAISHFSKALGFIQTEEVKSYVAAQKKLKAQAVSAAKTQKTKNIIMLLLTVMVIVFLNLMRNASAARKRAARQQRDQEFLELLDKNPREAKEAFAFYKETYPDQAPELASRLRDSMAKSGDVRLIREFAAELRPDELSSYILTAVQTLNASRQFQSSQDALGLMDLIPYQQWGEKEVSAFCALHDVMDPVLLDPSNYVSPEIWKAEVPASAYLALSNMYLARKEHIKAVQILEKKPKYSWEDDYWKVYLKCKAGIGAIKEVNIADLPDSMRLSFMEEMFRGGFSEEVNEYLLNEPRYKWKPEYYFYSFAITAQTKGPDDAMDLYRQLKEQASADKAAQVYYIIAVMCEHMGRPEKAVEIYQYMGALKADCMDSAARLAALSGGKAPAPTPSQILAQVLPKDYQYRKK